MDPIQTHFLTYLLSSYAKSGDVIAFKNYKVSLTYLSYLILDKMVERVDSFIPGSTVTVLTFVSRPNNLSMHSKLTIISSLFVEPIL